MRATQRLNSRGFAAYLVGGCVRDLLLGHKPKDYDIATEARPQQVKRTFPRNCRIIGRRFKLAHLHFHDNTKILEVSTFRRTPQMEGGDDDLLITRDNEFGNAEEDALRRDFTINALFLDPTRDRILDYAEGLPDLRARLIRTIGDPRVRFREDPVRILRAAKFAARLGFGIEPETLAAMAEVAPDLTRAAPPRLLEEILRLLRGGHALDSFQLLRDVGALKALLPVVAEFLARAGQPQRVLFWRLLEALDHRLAKGQPPSNPVLLGALFACPVQAQMELEPERSGSTIAEQLLGPMSLTLRLPRRDAGCLKRICAVQRRFEPEAGGEPRFRVAGFVHGPYFDEALELFELRVHAGGRPSELVSRWQQLREQAPAVVAAGDLEHDDLVDDAGAGAEMTADAAGDGEDGTDGAGGRDEARGDAEPADAQEPAADDGRRRRRRRRRGRRGRGGRSGGNQAFDGDDEPPAGSRESRPGAEADREPEREGEAREHDAERPRDAGEPAGERPPHERREPSADHDREGEPRDEPGHEPGEGDGSSAAAATAPGEPGGRRRRRRRGRRGRRGGGQRFPEGQVPAPHGDATDAAHHEAPAERSARAETDPNAPAPPGRPGHGEGGRRGRRRGRRHRDDRRHGRGNSDVDVVPRSRDRRGRVDVIEPPPLDLSAFDVELDPKRVPTFGSIVEGKSRPRRRGPRVPDSAGDTYKPPPPPGSDKDPPPPPPPTDSDVFGDW